MIQRWIVDKEGRVDKVLARHLKCSRSQVSKLIDLQAVWINGVSAAKSGIWLKGGEVIEYELKSTEPDKNTFLDFDIDIEILYEDDFLMVINKPAGLVVHPAPSVKVPTLVDWLKKHGVSLSTIYGEERHGIVHRIDKETTGALVVAKSNDAHRELSAQLKSKTMGRYYLALIDNPLRDHVTVDAPIARNPANRLKMAIVEGGREAKTDFMKLCELQDRSELIAARLHSGRTHQIRVHLGSLGRHILGDELYGCRGKKKVARRVFLHAYSIYFTHPVKKENMTIEAPLFDDMKSHIRDNIPKGVNYDRIIPKDISDDFRKLFSAL